MTVSTAPAASPSPPLWVRWVLVALWMGVIFLASAQANSGDQSHALARVILNALHVSATPDQAAEFHHLLRKAGHFTEYGVLALLAAWAQPGLSLGRAALTWVAIVGYASTDEIHQMFVPNRGPSPYDVMIDASGALVAMVLWLLAWRRR